MRLLGLLWRGSDTGADGPDGLVSDHDFAPVVDLLADGLQLSRVNGVGLAGLAFVKLLADACHDVQVLVERCLHLGGDDLVRFAENVASLAMAQDDPVETEVFEHGGACLTRVRTIIIERAILRRQLHLRASKSLLSGPNVQEIGSDNDLNLVLVEAERLEHIAGERATKVDSSIALPVSSD